MKRRIRGGAIGVFYCTLVVGIEARGGAQLGAKINRLGHEARLINPKPVKAYLVERRTTGNDAAALCEAVVSPQMRFVP